jgi:hypothetical protein
MYPLKQASPVRAFPVSWNHERFQLTGNRSTAFFAHGSYPLRHRCWGRYAIVGSGIPQRAMRKGFS